MSHLGLAREALERHFGFDAFKEGQDEVIEAILAGEDALVVMPTGGGKSLCYQLPALLRDGTTIVVSPLIALMKDQVDALEARQISATFINSSVDYEEQRARLRALRRGGYKLVYVAPERFRNDRFIEALSEIDVTLFAVDEAHCISEWGHDFRPDYRRLSAAIRRIGRPQVVALTATATPEVRADIAKQLELGDARHFIAGFDRPNLSLRVVQTSRERDKVRLTLDAVRGSTGAGIVYAATRKTVETVAACLESEGVRVLSYHAGLDDRARVRAQDAFMSGALDAIVATNAFGMGIDKSDIRSVVHYQMPGSIEAYYQEIGRAGRDGLPAECTLLFNYADTRFQQFFIEGSFPSPDVLSEVYRAVAALGPGRHELSARDLATRAGVKNDMAVSSALAILERAGHIERGVGTNQYATVVFGREDAVETGSSLSPAMSRVIDALTSPHAPAPGVARRVNLTVLAADSGLSLGHLRRALEQLDARGVLQYRPVFQERGIALLDEKPAAALRIDQGELARRAATEQRKLRRVVDYAYHTGCLRAYILSYFGDRKGSGACGSCSGCLGSGAVRRRRGDTAESAGGTLRVRKPREATDLDAFILENAPTGDSLREHLKSSARERKQFRAREVQTDAPSGDSASEPQPLDEEGTIVVRKVLSCVARARERFGKAVVAGVLRGSRAKNVIGPGLDALSTYGILSEMGQNEIVAWCDAILDAGLLSQAPGAFPTLQLTDLGKTVMRGDAEPRIDLAKWAVPLRRPAPASRRSPTSSVRSEPSVDVTFALFKAGMSVESIAEKRSLSLATIEGHLTELVSDGRIRDLVLLVDQAVYSEVAEVARKTGLDLLKPIHESLEGRIGYRDIRLVVAHLRRLGGA